MRSRFDDRAILLGPAIKPGLQCKKLIKSLKINNSDWLIGVDGGAHTWLKLGFMPNLAVGDWDSLKNTRSQRRVLKYLSHLTLPRDKDRSDLFYAACAAVNAGKKHLVCLGVTGGRPDHHLAMIYDLADIAAESGGQLKTVMALDADAEYYFLSKHIPQWIGRLLVGQTVSIFSINRITTGVTLTGMLYALKNAKLAPSSLGLSNKIVKQHCSVTLCSGRLLVLIPKEPKWSQV